jgi:hypothetical protein
MNYNILKVCQECGSSEDTGTIIKYYINGRAICERCRILKFKGVIYEV